MAYWTDDLKILCLSWFGRFKYVSVMHGVNKTITQGLFLHSICLYGLFMQHAGVLSPRQLESQGAFLLSSALRWQHSLTIYGGYQKLITAGGFHPCLTGKFETTSTINWQFLQ